MKSLTIKQFRYFEALADQGHFGRAAQVCAISQPALSVQIKELEPDLGKALFPYLLPRLIGDLQASYPVLDLHVRETLTPRLVQELSDSKLDAAIVALPVSEPSFTEIPLFTENFMFVRPAAQGNDPVPRGEDLAHMRLLLLEEGHCFRDQALAFCSTPSAVPRTGLDGSSLATLVQMVGAGIGVTVIPQIAVAVETRSAAVSCARFAGPQPQRTVGMIWRKSSPLTQQLNKMAEIVGQSAQSLFALG